MNVHDSDPPVFEKASLVRVPVRLGADAFTTGRISKQCQQLLIESMHGFRHLMAAHGVTGHRACATSAMREAENGEAVRDRVQRETGIDLRIITGRQEAGIILANGVTRQIEPSLTTIYADVGGGSCELTLFSRHELKMSESFRIGTVRMLAAGRDDSEWQRMKQWVRDAASSEPPSFVTGSGGNINKLFKLVRQQQPGHKRLQEEELVEAHQSLARLSVAERMVHFSLNPDRADVIVPAAEIYLALLRWSGCTEIFVPKAGLADGMCREMYREFKANTDSID